MAFIVTLGEHPNPDNDFDSWSVCALGVVLENSKRYTTIVRKIKLGTSKGKKSTTKNIDQTCDQEFRDELLASLDKKGYPDVKIDMVLDSPVVAVASDTDSDALASENAELKARIAELEASISVADLDPEPDEDKGSDDK